MTNKLPTEDYKGQADKNISKILKDQRTRELTSMKVSRPASKYLIGISKKKGYRGVWVLVDRLIELVKQYKWERDLK